MVLRGNEEQQAPAEKRDHRVWEATCGSNLPKTRGERGKGTGGIVPGGGGVRGIGGKGAQTVRDGYRIWHGPERGTNQRLFYEKVGTGEES